MLSASSSNNHSLFSFGRNGASKQTDEQATGSYDFLPSVSFDDLQTSIESASTEFTLTQFPYGLAPDTVWLDPAEAQYIKSKDQHIFQSLPTCLKPCNGEQTAAKVNRLRGYGRDYGDVDERSKTPP
ncbi:Dual specificity protein kinase-like protein [Emericellopsis cladophorae]|uniref:Dual specificity protein kinase-like protein n=1 Tax=Emericellopsis cladophorae TaxID=2686198 RepID=A0A9Q0BFU4_9HYPO|nr:Dual specificity protein kinase-like protein [Emericellopsis cladophorae]KAI6784367.1 Dual specificity protein kinase-like protein [Emericellopsis cladophorae]